MLLLVRRQAGGRRQREDSRFHRKKAETFPAYMSRYDFSISCFQERALLFHPLATAIIFYHHMIYLPLKYRARINGRQFL